MVQDISGPEALSPASVQARRQLEDAKRFLLTGDLKQAQDVCRQLLEEYAEYLGALETLGRTYIAMGKFEAALPCFVRASMLCPDEPSILARLGEVYFHMGGTETALQNLEQAVELGLDDSEAAEAYFTLGRVLESQREYERAIEYFDKSLAIDPGNGLAAYFLGICHEETGEQEKAIKAFRQALKGGLSITDQALVQYCISRGSASKAVKKIFADLDQLKSDLAEVANDKSDSVFFTAHIAAARAHALEGSGKHEDAWNSLVEANEPLNQLYADKHRMRDDMDEANFRRASEWNYAGPPQTASGKTELPVSLFIIGPSRAGKSTLERLVSSMKGVKPGYESEIVQAAANVTSNSSGLMALEYPGQLPFTLHRSFTRNYEEEVLKRAEGSKLFTITHPGLILDVGRIAETVPNAKFIFIERDTDDTALRIFGKIYLKGTNFYAYDVENIYEFLSGYSRLINSWSSVLSGVSMRVTLSVLSGQSMRVTYEEMIADPEKTRAQIAEFCGMPKPKGALPNLGDDTGCAKPYLDMLKKVRAGSSPEQLGGRWVSPSS